MSNIYRGTPNNRRTKARNFTQTYAQKRLEETVAAANQQYINSLYVNAVELDLYQITESDRPCTCEKTEMLPEFQLSAQQGNPTIPLQRDYGTDKNVEFEFQENIFGEPAEQNYTDEVLDVIDTGIQILKERNPNGLGNVEFAEAPLAGSNVKCGICYRRGVQPGYVAYGKQRDLFTTLDVIALDGYFINRTMAPHKFEKQHKDAYVEFKVTIPKYFRHVSMSIRDNCVEIQGAKLYDTAGNVLTLNTVRTAHGRELIFRVKEQQFTHCVLEFDMGIEKIRADISAEVMGQTYQQLISVSSFQVVMPPTLQQLNNLDVAIIKARNLAIVFNEIRPRQTSTRQRMGWDVQARVLQPNEDIRYIHNSTKLY